MIAVVVLVILLSLFGGKAKNAEIKSTHVNSILDGVERISKEEFENRGVEWENIIEPSRSVKHTLEKIKKDSSIYYDRYSQLDRILRDEWETDKAVLVGSRDNHTIVYYPHYYQSGNKVSVFLYDGSSDRQLYSLPTTPVADTSLNVSCDWLNRHSILCQIKVGRTRSPIQSYNYLINTNTGRVSIIDESLLPHDVGAFFDVDQNAPHFLIDSHDEKSILLLSNEDMSVKKTIVLPAEAIAQNKVNESKQHCRYYGQSNIICNLYSPATSPFVYQYDLKLNTWSHRPLGPILYSSDSPYALTLDCPLRTMPDLNGYWECEILTVDIEKNGGEKTRVIDIARAKGDHYSFPALMDGKYFYIGIGTAKGEKKAGSQKEYEYFVIDPEGIL